MPPPANSIPGNANVLHQTQQPIAAHATEERVFSNVILRTDAGDEIAVSGVPSNTAFVQIRTGEATYALRRTVVEGILGAANLTTNEQIKILMTFPVMAEVLPGQDAASRVRETEDEVSRELTPPTNLPSMTEFHVITQEWSKAMGQ